MEKDIYTKLAGQYTTDLILIESLWKEIENRYSEPHRHYHTLAHLDFLLSQLNEVKEQISDWDTILFSVFYHDIVYSTTAHDNEEKSAELAVERLQIGFPTEKIAKCREQILATKGHTITHDKDTDLFTDADLSILGTHADVYKRYSAQIRQEYIQYPDAAYNEGRKKVLQHFLNMPRIYKNGYFFDKFEWKARENLLHELSTL